MSYNCERREYRVHVCAVSYGMLHVPWQLVWTFVMVFVGSSIGLVNVIGQSFWLCVKMVLWSIQRNPLSNCQMEQIMSGSGSNPQGNLTTFKVPNRKQPNIDSLSSSFSRQCPSVSLKWFFFLTWDCITSQRKVLITVSLDQIHHTHNSVRSSLDSLSATWFLYLLNFEMKESSKVWSKLCISCNIPDIQIYTIQWPSTH